MGQPLEVGSKVMLPPLMPCRSCYYCVHYPETANKCLTPVYYGRYLGFEKPPHLWGGWAEMVYVDLDELPGTKVYKLPDDMPLVLGALSGPSPRASARPSPALVLPRGRNRRHPGLGADRRWPWLPPRRCGARHRRRGSRGSSARAVQALRPRPPSRSRTTKRRRPRRPCAA